MQFSTEIGQKTFFWYRVYCALMVLLYAGVLVFGIFLARGDFSTRDYSPQELALTGIIYAVVSTVLLIGFAVALFLPPKPYNWIVGLVTICIGMTSCCFAPFLIPLIIYWLKPETKAFFGRS